MCEAFDPMRRTYFTPTSEGKIKHLRLITPQGELLLPVALEVKTNGELRLDADGFVVPRKVGRKFLFVAPGGREVLR